MIEPLTPAEMAELQRLEREATDYKQNLFQDMLYNAAPRILAELVRLREEVQRLKFSLAIKIDREIGELNAAIEQISKGEFLILPESPKGQRIKHWRERIRQLESEAKNDH